MFLDVNTDGYNISNRQMVIILSTSTYYSQICCVRIVSNLKSESNSLNQIPFLKVSDARCIQIYVFNQHRITSWNVFICDKTIGYGVLWERKFDGINVQFCWGGPWYHLITCYKKWKV